MSIYPVDDSYDAIPPAQPRRAPEARSAAERLECALLGATIVLGALPRVAVRPEELASEAHQTAWRTVLEMHARGENIDLVTLAHELERTGRIENAGGWETVTALVDGVDCSAIDEYARRVKRDGLLRKLNRLSA